MKNFNDTEGNRIHDLLIYSAVPQKSAPLQDAGFLYHKSPASKGIVYFFKILLNIPLPHTLRSSERQFSFDCCTKTSHKLLFPPPCVLHDSPTQGPSSDHPNNIGEVPHNAFFSSLVFRLSLWSTYSTQHLVSQHHCLCSSLNMRDRFLYPHKSD